MNKSILEFSDVQQAKNSIIEKGTSKKNQSTKTQETSNVHQHRKRYIQCLLSSRKSNGIKESSSVD